MEAAVALLDDKATVPFIARYRKEATGGLDDTQLRTLEERLVYLRELEERRQAILESLKRAGQADAGARRRGPRRRHEGAGSRISISPTGPSGGRAAQIAREAGLEPLARGTAPGSRDAIPPRRPRPTSTPDQGVPDGAAALEGARWILIERFAEDPELVGGLRELLWNRGEFRSAVVAGQEETGAKFSDYFDASEPVKHDSVASRAGAAARPQGRRAAPRAHAARRRRPGPSEPERRIAGRAGITNQGRAADAWLAETVRWTWKVKLLAHLEHEIEQKLREQAEAEAIRVFGRNLHDLLLAAPAGQRVTMGLDPGIRTGVKVAVVDGTGKLLGSRDDLPARAAQGLGRLAADACRRCARRHGVQLDRDRQRHRVARDRQAGRRPDGPQSRHCR